jgi:hypothetical protein
VTPDEIKEVCTFWRQAEFERLDSAERTAGKQVDPAKQDKFRSLSSGSGLLHSLLNAFGPLHLCQFKAAVFAGKSSANAVA